MAHYILGNRGRGWGEFPNYYLNYDIDKYGWPEGTAGRYAFQVIHRTSEQF